jgi:hypothetical protein
MISTSTSREEARVKPMPGGRAAVARSNCCSRLGVQHLDGNCEEARAVTRGCGLLLPKADICGRRQQCQLGNRTPAARPMVQV